MYNKLSEFLGSARSKNEVAVIPRVPGKLIGWDFFQQQKKISIDFKRGTLLKHSPEPVSEVPWLTGTIKLLNNCNQLTCATNINACSQHVFTNERTYKNIQQFIHGFDIDDFVIWSI